MKRIIKKALRLFAVFFYRIVEAERILVLGDSHCLVFRNRWLLRRFWRKNFIMGLVGGATASGLENPNSKTQAYPQFKRMLEEEKYSKIILLLGEVDTGFVIWYRAKKYSRDVSEMFEQALNVYQKFLLEVAGYGSVAVISAPLPTIGDGEQKGEIAGLRREVSASQRERTQLTIEFNGRVQAFCGEHGICYLMLDELCCGDDGLVSNWMKNKNSADHHYDWERYARLLAPQMDPFLLRKKNFTKRKNTL